MAMVRSGASSCRPAPAPVSLRRCVIHAILTLHEKIKTGEITQRRNETGAGAGLQLDAPDRTIAIGTPR